MNNQKSAPDNVPVNILLVEDEPAHAEIVRRNLAALPVAHQLIHVEDGQLALDYLFARPAPALDLILLDLRLPKVDGLEVLRRIHEDDDMRNIPVVVLTTSAADSDLVTAFHLGAKRYQLKPGNFASYAELLEPNLPPAGDPAQTRA